MEQDFECSTLTHLVPILLSFVSSNTYAKHIVGYNKPMPPPHRNLVPLPADFDLEVAGLLPLEELHLRLKRLIAMHSTPIAGRSVRRCRSVWPPLRSKRRKLPNIHDLGGTYGGNSTRSNGTGNVGSHGQKDGRNLWATD